MWTGHVKDVMCQAVLHSGVHFQKSSKRLLNLQQCRAMMALEPDTVQCILARLSRVQMTPLAPGLHNTGGGTLTLCMEPRIAPPLSIGLKFGQRGEPLRSGPRGGAWLSVACGTVRHRALPVYVWATEPLVNPWSPKEILADHYSTPVLLGMNAVHQLD